MISGALVLSVVSYFGLLAWAVLAGEPQGGVLALAGGTAVASLLRTEVFGWPFVAEIGGIVAAGILSLVILPGLGLYWWLLQAGEGARRLGEFLIRPFRNRAPRN